MALIALSGHALGALSVLSCHGLSVPIPLVQMIDLLHCEVAGTGHQLAQAPVLALVREPYNPHDPDAIAVHLGTRKIGYLPRRHNTVLARLLDAGICLRAHVTQVADPEAAPWLTASSVIRSSSAGSFVAQATGFRRPDSICRSAST